MFILSKNKLLKKGGILILSVLIIFLLGINVVNAANFKYSSFNFNSFAEKNKDYWILSCKNIKDEEEQKECVDKIIGQQRKFYTKLYKLLARKESRQFFINDNIIIMTVFFEFDPSVFTDYSKAYNLDDDDNVDDDGENASAEFFNNETDTLKLLVNAMIGYERTCYGLKNPVIETHEETDEKGNKIQVEEKTCPNGGELKDNVCYYNFDGNKEAIKFSEKFAGTIQDFFGIKGKKANECSARAAEHGYSSSKSVDSGKKVLEDAYWEFLIDGNYLDRKPQLQHYYDKILKKSGSENMMDFYKNKYDNLSSSEKKEYEEEIVSIRKYIVSLIKDLVEKYEKANPQELENVDDCDGDFYWPIGSNETTKSGGKVFATGEPAFYHESSITSPFLRARVDPVGGQVVRPHTGIDIAGNQLVGVNNVIAAKSGVVSSVFDSCQSFASCSNGYGNHVMIQHSDGKYTLYGHLHQNTITVKVGDSVQQGQVIGKVGSSGNSTGPHLHFEVRTDASTPVNPKDYVDPENPRPSAVCGFGGQFMDWLISFEGNDAYLESLGYKIGNEYVVYCSSVDDVPTVGHGVTLAAGAQYFEKYGYHLTTSNRYKNYCGSRFPVDVVNKVKVDIVNAMNDSVVSQIASAGLSLERYQLDAVLSLYYNAGNRVPAFISAYRTYGNTQALCTNWWNSSYIRSQGVIVPALVERRRIECKLFTTGEYEMWG